MYLSIDIDFWNCLPVTSLVRVLKLVRDSGKLRAMVDNHKNLIPSVNSSGCSHLVNVDTHSDIMSIEDLKGYKDDPKHKLNCGNWANHIKKSLRDTFVWVAPRAHSIRCDGYYHGGYGPDIFAKPKEAGWRDIEEKVVKDFPISLIKKASDIGISVSYYYLESDLDKETVQQIFRDVFGKVVPHTSKDVW